MKYQVTATFFNFDKNGNPKPVKAGAIIPAKMFKALTPQKQAKCRPVAPQPKLRFSNAELDLAILLYLEHTKGEGSAVHNDEAIARMIDLNPKRSYASVNMLFCQIRALDVYVSQEGLSSQSKALVRKLYATDENRFPAGAESELECEANLDSLLAQIRA